MLLWTATTGHGGRGRRFHNGLLTLLLSEYSPPGGDDRSISTGVSSLSTTSSTTLTSSGHDQPMARTGGRGASDLWQFAKKCMYVETSSYSSYLEGWG
jgi:hypothetical protein